MTNLKILSCFILLLLGGCSFLDLHQDLKKQGTLVTITGEISITPATTALIQVVLVREDSDGRPEVARYTTLKRPGEYIFIIKPGIYRVLAFEDANKDQKLALSERVQASRRFDLTVPGKSQEANIEIGPSTDEELLAEIAQTKATGIIKWQKTLLQIGAITSLDAKNFSKENATKGLWRPYAFVQDVPFGLFFLEKYDPQKKIVLFVHGVSGTPAQFRTLIDNLDSQHFQPLVVFYPTGFPLPLTGQYLNSLVESLHATLDFDSISVVAHSMGGLVSRSFINIQSSYPDSLVDCFISISTPWNGHIAASSGLKYAPVVIPVWRDIAPKSVFLETLFTTPLQAQTAHYLFFGFKGSSRTTGGNSDGVISIASQLRPVAQEGAALIRGFDEDHVSILSNKEVSELVNYLLEKNL